MAANGFEGVSPKVAAAWAATQRQPAPVADLGPEWLSMRQIAAIWGCAVQTAQRRMQPLAVERATRMQTVADGRRLPFTVYRLKERP